MYLVILYITASRRVAKINGIFTILVFRLMCAVHVYLWHIHKPIKAYVYVRVCACMCVYVYACAYMFTNLYTHSSFIFQLQFAIMLDVLSKGYKKNDKYKHMVLAP